ncbi:MAG: DUF3604 domain-containing protein [Pseudomonadota bacterium]
MNLCGVRFAMVLLPLAMASCSKVDDPSIRAVHSSDLPAPVLRTTEFNPDRNLYWGDLHVHSSLSFDAYTMGVRTLPEDAWRYMKGDTIEHGLGYSIRAKRPLDFGAVTDHAEYLGVARHLAGEQVEDNAIRAAVQGGRPLNITWEFFRTAVLRVSSEEKKREQFGIPGLESVNRDAWQQIIDAAERHNVPGSFTTFIGYEWTSMPDAQNLHRNVIFRSGNVPERLYSSVDSVNPEDLWDVLDAQREEGIDSLAIPHNGNASNGLMYDDVTFNGEAINSEYATQRMRNEPISEILQVKGASETHPELSPKDEFAGFGIYDVPMKVSGGSQKNAGGYVRDALRAGLELSHRASLNPYRFGFIGSSDGHNSSSSVEEDNYHGKLPILDGSAGIRMGLSTLVPDDENRGKQWFAMGLAAVWAEENTRASLFDAMRRKETYSTSGPRISLRFFAGWNLQEADLSDSDGLQKVYQGGVPMGGELRGTGENSSPLFLVMAQKDPIGANLDRIQIIKGWVDKDGISHERIYNVAADDKSRFNSDGTLQPVGNTVNVKQATYRNNIGTPQLTAAWRDPNFNAALDAFYYARVIEIPTPKSTTFDAKLLGMEAPKPSSIQERAISSAIWYGPAQ